LFDPPLDRSMGCAGAQPTIGPGLCPSKSTNASCLWELGRHAERRTRRMREERGIRNARIYA
jgi:hypothetical protein